VLVTGAGSGIGLATAVRLAATQFHVIATVRSETKADAVRRAAAIAEVPVEIRYLDVADRDGCIQLVASLESLYAIVNNAGFNAVTAIEDATDEDAAHALEVMAVAPMRLARLGLPLLKASGGRVVQILSLAGHASLPLAGWYGAAKHALRSATDSFRLEVARTGVKVIAVAPGMVRTPIWDEPDHARSEYQAAYARLWKLNELAARHFIQEPDDVAQVVERVLTTRRPPTNVLIGADARVITTVQKWLPRRATDRILRATYGL
jgi:NAD(P)-dependent dehydrogenase (short-subunit alcohol dehydrogenase family)